MVLFYLCCKGTFLSCDVQYIMWRNEFMYDVQGVLQWSYLYKVCTILLCHLKHNTSPFNTHYFAK